MNKLQNIQALRGVAVFAVLLFHLVIIERKFGGNDAVLPDWLKFGMFGVDLFFVISGFVMVTVTRGKFQQAREALLFLYHRVSRIYPLYWVYTSMALIVFLVMPGWVNNSQGNQVNILASYLLIPSGLLPLVQVGWTLIYEMYFYLVFFFILLFLPERMLVFAMLAWGVVVTIFSTTSGNPYRILVFSPLTLEFIAGCLLAALYHKNRRIKLSGTNLGLISTAALIAAILGYVFYESKTGLAPLGWWEALLYGPPAAIIVFCITHAERNGHILPNFLIQCGNASYSIYLSHLFTVNVVGRIWALVSTQGIFDNIAAVLVAFGLAIWVGFLSYWYVELPLLKLSRKLA